ncbi:MAG TPA: CopD family protein [Acidimicrobiales bacterium]|nr:CopD family protein [Acidimicrobiales bacterium]
MPRGSGRVPYRAALTRLLVPGAATLAVAALALASLAGPAGAHALRVASSPDAGAVLQSPPSVVTVTFGERPDPKLSRLRVLDSAGGDETDGPTRAVAGQPLTLQVHVHHLARGVYTVAWTTVSAVDGHIASGTFAFGVGVAPSGAAATATTATSPAESPFSLVGRWLTYAGLMLLVGGAVVGLSCFDRPPRRSWPRLAIVAWLAAVAGALVLAATEASQAGIGAGEWWGSLHRQLEYRIGPLLVAALVLVVPVLRRPRRALAVLGVAGAVAMWGDVNLSHAAAAIRDEPLKAFEQWAHFVAAGVWIGGLLTLLVGLGGLEPSLRARAARRFSTIALVAVVVLVAGGVLRAVDEVGTWQALTSTTFGQALLVKIGLLVVLVGLGAWNRYRAVPSVEGSPQGLVRTARFELGLAAVVLVATAILQGQAPPASVAATSGPPPLVVSGHDFADTVAVSLSISPGTAGFNQFVAHVTDPTSHHPLRAAVTLTFALPSRSDLGSSTLRLARQSDGTYAASGANLSIDGTWDVTALVQQSTTASQIELHVTTRAAPEHITIEHDPGLPDLYTIALPDSQSVQVYLDPGRTGFNEFHVTYVGADGREISMRSLSVKATGPDASATPAHLTVRRLDSVGHFVADLPGTQRGRYRFVLDAEARGGTPFTSTVTIPVP